MLHNENTEIRARRFEGMIGLELESQRVDRSGCLARTRHPFPHDHHIVRDFGEAQLEINTSPAGSPMAVQGSLHAILGNVHQVLRERGELLWPFSNPPVIRSEEDIEIASFPGKDNQKEQYRRYLARKYGKYQMTFSGIHFNYSFSEELLWRNALLEGAKTPEDFRKCKDRFYLELAEQILAHSWVVVALLGASPLLDSSFYEVGRTGETIFTGSASLRSSPMGYWNHFTPLLSYENMDAYVDSIKCFIDRGLISQESELYYPVRIKCSGAYSLKGLRERGADYIELRMIDLNPFSLDGIDQDDLRFLQLLLIWLSSRPRRRLDASGQLFSLQNHKNAAAFDWNISRILGKDGVYMPLSDALDGVLTQMEDFFAENGPTVRAALEAQRAKLCDPARRYAYRVRLDYGRDYIRSGLRRAKEIQEAHDHV
ncbi:MAG: hypothetical protein Q4A32_09070 [Lachnospiraceae bacterium]|nr:hypothetical protein [Lachnospiraceae bacterium]